jgi:hypothetical protein
MRRRAGEEPQGRVVQGIFTRKLNDLQPSGPLVLVEMLDGLLDALEEAKGRPRQRKSRAFDVRYAPDNGTKADMD